VLIGALMSCILVAVGILVFVRTERAVLKEI
jgi:ABC-2 type transport system permease protein